MGPYLYFTNFGVLLVIIVRMRMKIGKFEEIQEEAVRTSLKSFEENPRSFEVGTERGPITYLNILVRRSFEG